MIKNILLPEKIGSYFFFPQRILGFYIGKTMVTAAQVYCKGSQRTIEKTFTALIPPEPAEFQPWVSAAVTQILSQADKYDAVYSSFPSSMAFFKELTVPFTSREKIALIYEYEIAPQLPFGLDAAVLDFVITRTDTSAQQADILICAVQKIHLAELLAIFEGAGVSPQKVMVDILGLYGLYQEIPTLTELSGNVALIHAGSSAKIGFIVNNQLKFVRGSAKLDMQQIQFTLNAFAQKTENHKVDQIVVTGPSLDQIKLDVPTMVFPLESISTIPHVSVRADLLQSTTMALSIALPHKFTQNFNLRSKEFGVDDSALFIKQLATAGTLAVLTLGLLFGHGFWQARKVNASIAKSEKELIVALSAIPNVAGSKKAAQAIETAQEEVDKQERIWFAFTSRTRSSFLSYLQKLSSAIDRDSLKLALQKLIMSHDQIRLMGEVKDVPALVLLEDQLRSTGLGAFASPQEPKFDIAIALSKEQQGVS